MFEDLPCREEDLTAAEPAIFSFFFFLSFFCFSDATSGELEGGLFLGADILVKSLEQGDFVVVTESSASDSEDSGSEDSARPGQSSTASAVSLVGVL